jgi:drug/metabolite transporter (DMT)-like permease
MYIAPIGSMYGLEHLLFSSFRYIYNSFLLVYVEKRRKKITLWEQLKMKMFFLAIMFNNGFNVCLINCLGDGGLRI